jgi:hypothetical protein
MKGWLLLRGPHRWILFLAIGLLAIGLTASTLGYLHPSASFACHGFLGAGFPVAFACDYSSGSSPPSSWGKIDGADWPFLSLQGTIVDILFYAVLLLIALLLVVEIYHLVRRHSRG